MFNTILNSTTNESTQSTDSNKASSKGDTMPAGKLEPKPAQASEQELEQSVTAFDDHDSTSTKESRAMGDAMSAPKLRRRPSQHPEQEPE